MLNIMKKQNYKNRSLKLSICPIALAVLSAFFFARLCNRS